MAGVHTALAHIFKLGHRSDLLGQLPRLGPLSSGAHELLASNSVTKRKLGIKLLQRVGLVYLPPRVASWRYQRGNRSLLHNLQASGAPTEGTADAAADAAPAPAEEEGEEALVAEEVEGVLEQLLTGLKDADTVVRWSAAKGVGRLTGRLPLELADDVVEQVLELRTPDETPNSWHGGCLALAELSRRGLLLPRGSRGAPAGTKALHFDVARGASSVGTPSATPRATSRGPSARVRAGRDGAARARSRPPSSSSSSSTARSTSAAPPPPPSRSTSAARAPSRTASRS